MSQFLHADENDYDNNDAKALAIPSVSSEKS